MKKEKQAEHALTCLHRPFGFVTEGPGVEFGKVGKPHRQHSSQSSCVRPRDSDGSTLHSPAGLVLRGIALCYLGRMHIRNHSYVGFSTTAGPRATLGYLRRLLHPGDRELGNSELGGPVLHRYSVKTNSVLVVGVWVEGAKTAKST